MLGEGNGTHSSTLAWKIPWMEEPGRLQSMGSLRVGHDWATSLSLFTFMHWRRKWQPIPVFLPGEFQGRGSLVGCQTSLGSHRVGHNWSNLAAAVAAAIVHCVYNIYHIFFIHSSLDRHLAFVIFVSAAWRNLLWIFCFVIQVSGSPGGTVVKNLPANARGTRDAGSIPGWGRTPA